MAKGKISAKDAAFEKERAKFRSEIRQLQQDLKNKDAKIRELEDTIFEKEAELEAKDDWIRRLLEYTELTPEEMKKFIEKEKLSSKVMDSMRSLEPFFKILSGQGFMQ